MRKASWPLERPLDLKATLGRLRGGSAPTRWLHADRALWAGRWASGEATLALEVADGCMEASACGPGSSEALESVPRLVGLDDHHGPLFDAAPPALARLARQRTAFRMGATDDLVGALLPAVLGQRVTAREAHGSWARLCADFGEPAPSVGAFPTSQLSTSPLPTLRVPPRPQVLARLTSHELHRYGVERSRGDLLIGLARRATSLNALTVHPPAEVRRRLQTLPGVGPWTSSIATRVAQGDPDAVLIGDLHLPSMITWALAGEERGDDDRMLELLEPSTGQRARVQQLVKSSGLRAPRRGPKYSPLPIARM